MEPFTKGRNETVIQKTVNKDGTISIYDPDSFAPHGTIGGTPSRPEKEWDREAKADKMPISEKAKMLATAVDQLGFWDKWGAPPAIGRRIVGTYGSEPIYSRAQYVRWIGEIRDVCEAVARIRV